MANSAEQISQIKVISENFVKPNYEVEASKQPYYLGPIDLWFLGNRPTQEGLLFPTKPTDVLSHLIEKLHKSLSIALVHFYPLAGRFASEIYPDEGTKWVYIDCNKGPGARLIHASVDLNVSDIIMPSEDAHSIVRYLFDIGEETHNHDGHTRPLLSVQVTELIDGIFIGFTMNHSVVDGTSRWHFINALSEIFLQIDKGTLTSISVEPIFKPYFPDGFGPIFKLPYNPDEDDKVTTTARDDPVTIRERRFHFSSTSISKLKAKANEECGVHNISSFQALSAFMWRSITRARNLEAHQETLFALVINARPRFNPPLSEEHFGNFVTMNHAICKAEELLSNGLGSTAMLIHQAIASQDEEATREFFKKIAKSLCEAPNNNNNVFNLPKIVVGGSAKFNMYRAEFGLGKAVAWLPGYSYGVERMVASPGSEGGGSVVLQVCLNSETMNALESDEELMSLVTMA